MTWIIGLIAFAVGLIAGAVIYKQFRSDEAKVKMLEDKLEALEQEHEAYKNNVHAHFNNTAQLLNNLTESYRDVYRHMAAGAQALCPEYISDQLSHTARAQESLSTEAPAGETENQEPSPPRDYADKLNPDQKGRLSEDYGLDDYKSESRESS